MSPSRTKRIHRQQRRERVRAHMDALRRPAFIEPVLDAWSHACWALNVVFVLFETTPRDLAEQECIARWRWREICQWVGPLETLVRRIVLAAALTLTIVLKPLRQIARKPGKGRRVIIWPHRPESWIARLRILEPRPARRRPIPSKPAHEASWDDMAWMNSSEDRPRRVPTVVMTFPLARRLEAIRRVLANPQRHAHRVAVKLARIAARNATANEPRRIFLRPWDPGRFIPRGKGYVDTAMREMTDLITDHIDTGNLRLEPG